MNVMLDLETLGTRPGCVILSIGAVEFDAHGLHREFYREINVDSSVCAGLTMDQSTLDWWSKQSPDAQRVLTACRRSGYILEDSLRDFSLFLLQTGHDPKRIKIWGNGADFDNTILCAAYRAVGGKYPIEFWNNRCFRTLKSTVPGAKELEPIRAGVFHNALDDAKHQARWAVTLLARLKMSDDLRQYELVRQSAASLPVSDGQPVASQGVESGHP